MPNFLFCYYSVPTWPYVKAVAIILLVLPFQGASYIYKRFIRAYFVEKLHFFVPTRQDDAASIADADMKCLRNEPKELEKHIVSQVGLIKLHYMLKSCTFTRDRVSGVQDLLLNLIDS